MHTAVAEGTSADDGSAIHDGLLYRSESDYVDGVLSFVRPGLLAGDPVFVAVPEANCDVLRARLPDSAAGVQFADMTKVGRNPARIIPAIQRFVDEHPGREIRFVGEPIWPGRTAAEICEATRHEAMLNTVFGNTTVHILCPYDLAGLDPATVADAWRTHPTMVDADGRSVSASYAMPTTLYDAADPLTPEAPKTARKVAIRSGGLPDLRDQVREYAADAGLPSPRVRDLVLSANEIATNTLMHTGGEGSIVMWCDPLNVICEVRDNGYIGDPLAGRHRPAGDAARGRGMWMANHLCDLVQWRSDERGTRVRLHVRFAEG